MGVLDKDQDKDCHARTPPIWPAYRTCVQLFALFDLDNTLIDRQAALKRWVRDFSASRGLAPDAELLLGDTLRARAYPADFDRLRDPLGLSGSAASLWSEYVSGMSARARCLPGLPDALSQMRAIGWTLGVVTNGAADIQRAKLESAGLADLFDGVCASGEVGVRKPALAVFQAAAERCGTTLAKGAGWWATTPRQTSKVAARRGCGRHGFPPGGSGRQVSAAPTLSRGLPQRQSACCWSKTRITPPARCEASRGPHQCPASGPANLPSAP